MPYITADDIYVYPFVSKMAVNSVMRRYKGAARRAVGKLPPVVIAFVYNSFGPKAGYPITVRGSVATMETMLQHIEISVIDDYRAQLRVWARSSGPMFERKAVAPLPRPAGATSPGENPKDLPGAAAACAKALRRQCVPAISRTIACSRD